MEQPARPYVAPPRISRPKVSILISTFAGLGGVFLMMVGAGGDSASATGFGGFLIALASGLAFRALFRGLAADLELRMIDMQLGAGQIFKPKDETQ